jgi:cyanophycinase
MNPRSLAATTALALTLILTLATCAGDQAPSAEAGPQAGRLVIIGGGLQADNTDVYQAIIDGREGGGPICVFPTASAEPAESMASAIERINAVGGEGTAEGVFLTVENPEDAGLPETVSRIESCSGFYFSGGQQRRIVQVFRPEGGDSPAYQALIRRHREGAVVSGTSAGAAIMNDPMIGGGSSVGALTAGVRGPDGEEGVMLRKGMGFWDQAFVDQHFLARGRWARLLVAVLATDGLEFGMGIDENTALVVDGDHAWVAGASGVAYFDTRAAVRDEAGNVGSEIVLSLLGSGDGVDLTTGAVQVAGGKGSVLPRSTPAAAPDPLENELATMVTTEDGIFERWSLLRFLGAMADSEATDITFSQNDHAFHFEKMEGFRARSWEGPGVEGLPAGLSLGPFRLSVLATGDG